MQLIKFPLLFFLFVSFLFSCNEKTIEDAKLKVRADIRRFDTFYSINIKEDGQTFVAKGVGSNFLDSLNVLESDTSKSFMLDSAAVFFKKIGAFRSSPVFRENKTGNMERAEVYYEGQKIFDSFAWDESYWDLFRPIMTQLPEGFNPFRIEGSKNP